jgi:hypothetical protein
VRARQLTVRTLLTGMCLTQADGRPAHLTRVHQALTSLPGEQQQQPGVIAEWKHGPHLLTYRQVERTFALVAAALAKDEPEGLPSAQLQAACDDLLEASIPGQHKTASTALAIDWTDMETFSRPPPKGTRDCADPEASWGHRKDNRLHRDDELSCGYYLSAATMMPAEHGPPAPEYARRITLSSCRQDPVPAFVPVLTALPAAGIPLGETLADSGYAYRIPANWAVPLRAAGAQLIQDLHPADRGPHGTHHGAVISNGNLYCPGTPRQLLEPGPLAPGATREQAASHDTRTAELARCKPGRITSDDPDGYHRVMCPAATGKIRCPLRPATGPARLLHPADPDRPPGHHGQDRPETRLPLRRAPPLLQQAHRRRTRFLHYQGPLPATSPAAGAASWAWPPGCCSPPPCSSPAISASPPPGTGTRQRPPAGPPVSRPEPAAGAAKPPPASSQHRHNHHQRPDHHEHAPPGSASTPRNRHLRRKATSRARNAPDSEHHKPARKSDPDAKITHEPKHEQGPHSNVKTSL